MKTLLLVTLFALQATFVFSQSTANYTFSNVTNASLTDMSTGTTNILVPSTTSGDYASTLAAIGFDFWLMGIRYDHFSVNSNGLMRLGKTVVTTAFSNTAANSATNTPSLFAFWDDLNSYTTSSTSKVRYKVTGTAPNRILTVEWKDFIISYNSSSSTQLSTWQVRLYETTGVFEYVYGTMQIASSSATVTASIGMTYANSNNNLIYITSISSPAVLRTSAGFITNLVNSSTAGNITNLNSASNGSRVMYTFTPPAVSASAPSGLNFTAVGTSSMTLNWTDNSSNEDGFAIYRSDDGGVTYTYVSQVAANATSSVQSALSPGTTYYWKVYAVTEGALSSALNGNQATTACGVPVTNTMALIIGGAYNWNTAANWSLGHVPTACENAVITFTRLIAVTSTAQVTMNASASVNNLNINAVYGSSGTKLLQVLTNGYSLTVNGNLSISSTGGTAAANEVDLLASTGSVVTVKGSSTIGQVADTRISFIGGTVSNTPDFYFKGNLTFNANAGCSAPGIYYFDGGASQSITNNATTYAVTFGEAEIGRLAATTLTLGGTSAYNTYTSGGNLTVNSGSTLVLPSNQTFNQYTAGSEVLILKANATLKLGDYFGGQTGSNFPTGYSNFSIDAASTVEYNYSGGSSPVIYTGIIYGNLTLTNASRKYINTTLFIDGNLTNNTGSTLGSDVGTYVYGASVVNNGLIDGLYANSEFGFYGTTAQTYSGSGTIGTSATPFGSWGIDIFNPAGVTLNAPIYTYRVNLFNGAFTNSNQLKIGTLLSYGTLQRGGASAYVAGSFDTYPVINSINSLYLRYDDAAAIITTGPEIPATGKTYTVYSNNVNAVTLTSNLNITNDFQLLQNTFDIAANTLQIGNTITRTSGNINGSAGTMEMNGTVAQAIPASTFQSNNLKNLIISNTNAATGVTLGGTLDIYRSVTFGSGGKILTTADLLTFKSTSTETAWLGQMAATNSIVGKATIERYIPLHSKAWQLLSTPITAGSTQTVNAAWQEGSVAVNDNLVSGYGTQLTSNRAGATTRPSPGFDAYTSPGPSIKVYNHSTGGYIGLNRTDTAISNPKGYMVFVRGNRSVITSGGAATATIMRTKGTLHTPANPPVTINIATPGFESVGNPYASAIDYRQVTLTGGVQTDFFYMWDPKLTSGPYSPWGLGGFQSFSWNSGTSTFDVTPGGGSYTGSNRYIESGQAFFVNAPLAAGTVAFTETSKTSGSNDVNRAPVTSGRQLRTNLHVITGNNRILLDGNLVQFDRSWSNLVDINDGIKLNNTGENLGMLRSGKTLVVERRAPIQITDTVFYKLGQVKVQQYELEFIPNGLQQQEQAAYLEDRYLHISTSVSLHDTTRILFNIINVPGSYATDRFRLVFRQRDREEVPPIGKINTKADNNSITAGKGIIIASNNDIAQKPTANTKPGINVYPNPVINKAMQLQFINQLPGIYSLQLSNKLGQLVYSGSIQLNNDLAVRSIQLDQGIVTGTYQLTIISTDGTKTSQQVIIQ